MKESPKLMWRDKPDRFSRENVSLCWSCGDYRNTSLRILACYQVTCRCSWYDLPLVILTGKSDGQRWIKIRSCYLKLRESSVFCQALCQNLESYLATPVCPNNFFTFTHCNFYLHEEQNACTVEPCRKGEQRCTIRLTKLCLDGRGTSLIVIANFKFENDYVLWAVVCLWTTPWQPL